jgi:hypothetical protein
MTARRVVVACEIVGSELPGRRCGTTPEGGWCENVHVGLARRQETVELIPGDAAEARWAFEITVKVGDGGELDFGGPFVNGPREDRHLGLRWGTLGEDGSFDVFRAAKLRMTDIDRAVIEQAAVPGYRLVARLCLTDAQGWPVCARVRPPAIAWSAEVSPI